MALVKFGVAVVGARGTAGGLTFSANKAGPYIKTWSKSANPRSPAQSLHRNKLADFATNWATLSSAEHDDWDDYADDPAQELTNSLGLDYFISGFNWYVRINLNLQAGGDSPRDDAPTLTRPIAPTVANFVARSTASAFTTRFDYTGEGPEISDLHGVVARTFNSHGRTALASNFTFMTLAVPSDGDQVKFQDELEAAFGVIQLDQRIFGQTYIQDAHGQRGPIATAFDDAIA